MFASFEEKGKIYTNVISKDPIEVIIQTTAQRIRGKIYIRPEERMIDEINQSVGYLAVTEAHVYDPQGMVVFQTNFMTVNRTQIIWVIPVSELLPSEKSV
jgi:hypothetical protein